MSKPKIAIIGANEAISMLIKKAKEKGYETHAFAWASGDSGEKEADVFYPISIAEKEKIAEKCKELGVIGVASITSDFAVNTVNYVARTLGLVGNSEKTDEVARNKYKMRCAFCEAGLFTPHFCETDNDFDISLVSGFKFPLIVKPTDRWSSKGVTRVEKPEDLCEAIAVAVKESMNGKAIVEEFMDGPEYSAECICYNGNFDILTFTKKQTTGFPHYIETGHIQPSDIPEKYHSEIKEQIYRALKALDIQNGAAHAEFRIIDGVSKIGIIEIGARMGGDYIGTDLTPISTGKDYIGMVVDIACGKSPDSSVKSQPSKVCVKFILSQGDYDEYLNFSRENPGKIVRSLIGNTKFNHQVVDSSTRYGYYIIAE